jgi:hypothetical protein
LNIVKVNISYRNHPLSFEGFFFNEEAFLQKQGEKKHTFVLLNSGEKIIARSTLFLKDQVGLSPLRAPFGSVEFENDLPGSELEPLIQEINTFAVKNKLKKVKMVSYPDCYDFSNTAVLKEVLIKNGFKAVTKDHNFHMEVTPGEFDSSLHASEKRRLKKSQIAGFQFNVETDADLSSVHEMISKCREYKGYPLSMNYDEFKGMFKEFPGRYVLFTLRDKGRLVATAIGVRINADILYNFMPADEMEYRNFSPMVLLMKGVYDYCSNHGYKIFDMGTAGENGIPNSSLIKFKENLGGKLSFKLTFEKDFIIE